MAYGNLKFYFEVKVTYIQKQPKRSGKQPIRSKVKKVKAIPVGREGP
jgi:hypothetical protein